MIEDATISSADQNQETAEPNTTPDIHIHVEHSGEEAALDLKEAAFILGKSMRALERSLTGKWGNRLPSGWTAKRAMVDGEEQWKILPPPGFNLDSLNEQKRPVNKTRAEPAETENENEGKNWLSVWRKDQEVFSLLKDLAATNRELADERRAHIADLRLLNELQSSIRLLETAASNTSELKSELLEAQKDLLSLKNEYQSLLNRPWWKRLWQNR